MIQPLNENDIIIINNMEYTVVFLLQTSESRCVYKIKSRQGVTYVLKEIITDSFVLRKSLYRDKHNVAVPNLELCRELGISPEAALSCAKPIGVPEQENNATAIQDLAACNNSNYFFQTEKVCENPGAAYFLVNTEAGDPLDRLAGDWCSRAKGDRLLLAVTELMITLCDALIYLHEEKRMLHLDIKPQNVYALGKGFDRTVKLLDLGSAIGIDQLYENTDKQLYRGSTFFYESPLQREISNMADSGDSRLSELIRELSEKDDIYALSKVMAYLLLETTKTNGKVILNGANPYCVGLLNDILGLAAEGAYITVNGKHFKTGKYKSVSMLKEDLKKLCDALKNKGLSETVMLKKGLEYHDNLLRNRRKMVIPEMIPTLHVEGNRGKNYKDGVSVYDLWETLISEKHDIMICSQGGAGKSFLLYQMFSALLLDAQVYPVIPVFLRLESIGSGKNCVLNAIVDKYTGINVSDLTEGMTKSDKLIDFFETTNRRIVILADSLNEIPGTDPLLRGYAIDALRKLAQFENVSVIVTSRYNELSFCDFESYRLNPLSEEYLSEMVEGYEKLDEKLRLLLTTPFNLSLYLGLSRKRKERRLLTASDLLQANIDEIKEKTISTVSPDESEFILKCVFPILSYKMSKTNKLVFSLLDAKETVELCCWLFQGAKYRFIRSIIQNDINDFVCRIACYLRDYDLIAFLDDDGTSFEISHENYRNWFGAKGWMSTAERFKLYYERYDEELAANTFTPPVSILAYLKEIIEGIDWELSLRFINAASTGDDTSSDNSKSYFERLFKTTTKNLFNHKAAEFNRIVFRTLKAVYIVDKENSDLLDFPEINMDFSCLDLSLVNLSGLCLNKCDFSHADLSEFAFDSPTISMEADWLWNNDEIAIMLYKEGFIRCVSFLTGTLYEVNTQRFEAFYVKNDVIYLVRNIFPREIVSNEKNEMEPISMEKINNSCSQSFENAIYFYYDHQKTEGVIPIDGKLPQIVIGEMETVRLQTGELIWKHKLIVPFYNGKRFLKETISDSINNKKRVNCFFDFSDHQVQFAIIDDIETQTDKYFWGLNDYFVKDFYFDADGYLYVCFGEGLLVFNKLEENYRFLCVYYFNEILSRNTVKYSTDQDRIMIHYGFFKFCKKEQSDNSIVLYAVNPNSDEIFFVLSKGESDTEPFNQHKPFIKREILRDYSYFSSIDLIDRRIVIGLNKRSLSKPVFQIFSLDGELEKISGELPERMIVATRENHEDPLEADIVCSNSFLFDKTTVIQVDSLSCVSVGKRVICTENENHLKVWYTDFSQQERIDKEPYLNFYFVPYGYDFGSFRNHITQRVYHVNKSSPLKLNPIVVNSKEDKQAFSIKGTEVYPYAKKYFRPCDYEITESIYDSFLELFQTGESPKKDSFWGINGINLSKEKSIIDDDVLYIKDTVVYNLREKFQTVADRGEIERLECWYHRFIVGYVLDVLSISGLILLDLKTDKAVYVDIHKLFFRDILTVQDITWVDTGDEFGGCLIQNIFVQINADTYKVEVDLQEGLASIVYSTRNYPWVDMIECDFSEVKVVIDEQRHKPFYNESAKSNEKEKKIIQTWRDNNIESD
ncbi:MAG: hypothetical protein IJH07_02215 [Ruminococcus sp.]|nr:hypothetical protein [Ruminococcus sp.]